MTWVEIAGLGVASAGTVGVVSWRLIRSQADKVFAPKTLEEEHAKTHQMANDNRDRLVLLEQAQRHHTELMQESVVKPLAEIKEQLGTMAAAERETSLEVVRLGEGQRSLGRSLDEVRDRMDREGR